MNGDDETGILPSQLRRVLRKCRFFRFVLVEVAVDFSPKLGVDRRFVRRHGAFGKSRRRPDRGGPGQVRYGSRKSGKLVRCYWKEEVNAFRVELELHSPLLRKFRIDKLADIADVPYCIFPKHLRFVRFRWGALSRHLNGRFGLRGEAILAAVRDKDDVSLARGSKYLRRKGVNNVHRFLEPLRVNRSVEEALIRWSFQFQEGVNG